MKNFLALLFSTGVVVITAFVVLGYSQNLEWVGVGDYTTPQVGEGQEYQRSKTLWDWMELLIVPIALGGGAWLLSENQKAIEEKQAIEKRRQEDYEDYLVRVWEILDKYNSPASLNASDFARSTLKAWTLVVLKDLDARRKGNIIQYLYETGLIIGDSCPLKLQKADLSGADLQGRFLPGINLSDSILTGANLRDAILGGQFSINEEKLAPYLSPDIDLAMVTKGKLLSANLARADLTGANLAGARLSEVNWTGAVLQEVDLKGAIADLEAIRREAGVFTELPQWKRRLRNLV